MILISDKKFVIEIVKFGYIVATSFSYVLFWFWGEYFHWICKGSVRGVDEVAVVSTLRTGSRHIGTCWNGILNCVFCIWEVVFYDVGFNFLCYYFSPKMSFHFEHPYYSADEVPSTEITKKIESYVVQVRFDLIFFSHCSYFRKSIIRLSLWSFLPPRNLI